VDNALSTVLPYKSAETGLLHLHPEIYEGLSVQAAPTYENFLFVLLLLRKKTHEHVNEAKILLRRLFAFQNFSSNEQNGNFPVELTEYPVCRDWLLSLRLGLVLAAIRMDFFSILGEELGAQLIRSQKALLESAKATQQQIAFSLSKKMLFDIEMALFDPSLPIHVEEELLIDSSEWMCPSTFGKILAAASYLPTKLSILPSFALQLWHKKATTYQGPACGVYQFGKDPEVTLFDFYCSLLANIPLNDKSWPYIDALELALLHPKMCMIEQDFSFPTDISWSVQKASEVTIASCFFSPKHPEGFHPIRVVTPESTFVFQFPNGSLVSLEPQGKGFVGTVLRTKEPDEDDPTLLRCFVERKKSMKILAGGEQSTTFDSYQGVTFDCHSVCCSIVLGSQEAETFGHVSLHNRSGQILARRKLDSFGYDWLISIEYLRGKFQNPYTFFLTFAP
jgi:hypothetical protein